MSGTRRLTAFAIAAASALAFGFAAADDSPPAASQARQQIEALVAQLSDDDFTARDEARRKLQTLGSAPKSAAEVRAVVEARLAAKPTDWELRATLEAIRRRLPTENPEPPVAAPATSAAIDTIFQELESSKFSLREQAAERLRPIASNPATCGVVMRRIKTRLDDPALDLETVRRLLPLWNDSWGTWLAKPPLPSEPKAAIDERELSKLIEQLIEPLSPNLAISHPLLAPYAAAERELLYLLACDETFKPVRDALEKRLEQADAAGLAPESFERLHRVFEWTKPAMVAEYWQNGEHKSLQHLTLGVPNQPAGAPNPSLFDRCDERFAHCVSGNSLSPGDWPVGIFFPHPIATAGPAQFHLKNLPTPRRRLAYEFEVPTTLSRERQVALDTARRKPISRRTCEYYLARRQALNEREIEMLAYLDSHELSRFAKAYLLNVDDVRVPNESPVAFGNGSSHGNFCYQLSLVGTAAAGPAMVAAIQNNRVLEPTGPTPFRMDWISLFALTERVDWPGCDEWLASQIGKTEPMHIGDPKSATTGASAAALLIRRKDRKPSEFGLEQRYFSELIDLGNPCYRFTDSDGPAAVNKWWQEANEAARKVAP